MSLVARRVWIHGNQNDFGPVVAARGRDAGPARRGKGMELTDSELEDVELASGSTRGGRPEAGNDAGDAAIAASSSGVSASSASSSARGRLLPLLSLIAALGGFSALGARPAPAANPQF